MNTRVAARRLLHISDSPDEGQLLEAELAEGETPLSIERVDSRAALHQGVERDHVDLIIADLPLPWPGAHDDVAELQRARPEIEIVFRWGEPGQRTAEPEATQIERLVAERLAGRATRPQSEAERRAFFRELARRQEAFLRIQRNSLWDFQQTLRDVARGAAELLEVERVSVWEFSQDRSTLDCAVLYLRTPAVFESGAQLQPSPRYLRALELSLSLVANDCLRDPRTSAFAADYFLPLGITSLLDSPIRVDGQVVGVLCIEHVGELRRWSVLDQSAASGLACHLGRAYDVRRRREAERRLAALERLDAGQIAHDFNNRLTVLTGWVGLLAHDVQSGSSAEHCVAELESELARATAHVRELLNLGQGPPTRPAASVDLRSELERQEASLRRVLGPAVEFDVDIRTDATRIPLSARELESVLLNLASNSRDALAGRGRVCVIVEDGEARAPGQPAPATTVRLVFEDDGPGFSERALKHLFEPLFTTKKASQGSGLGLSSVARVVRQANGTVRAENHTPRGARVVLEFPGVR